MGLPLPPKVDLRPFPPPRSSAAMARPDPAAPSDGVGPAANPNRWGGPRNG